MPETESTVKRKRKSNAERLEELREKRRQLDARIQRAKARQRLAEKKIEERRMYTLGRCLMDASANDRKIMAWLSSQLNAQLKRPYHRKACIPYLPVPSRPMGEVQPAPYDPDPRTRTARKLNYLRQYLMGSCASKAAEEDVTVRTWLGWLLGQYPLDPREIAACERVVPVISGQPGAEPPPLPPLRGPVPDQQLRIRRSSGNGRSLASRIRRKPEAK